MSAAGPAAAADGGIEGAGLIYYKAGPEAFEHLVTFFRDDLGLPLKFTDGAGWAAFDGGGVTVAVEGGELTGADVEGPILGFRVSGLDEAVARLAARHEVAPTSVGGHERRSGVQGPLPGPVVLYEPLQA